MEDGREFIHPIERLIVSRDQKIMPNNEVDLFGVKIILRPARRLASRRSGQGGSLPVTNLTNREVEDEINEFAIPINFRTERRISQLADYHGMNLILVGHRSELWLGRRFKINPSQSFVFAPRKHLRTLQYIALAR